MDWDGFADDVLAVVDAWGVDELVAVGHSKGGAALLLAEQRRPGTFRAPVPVRADRVPGRRRTALRRTAVRDVPVGGAEQSVDRTAHGADQPAGGGPRRRATFASCDAAYDNYASKPPLSVLDPAALRAYVDHGFADQPDGTVRSSADPRSSRPSSRWRLTTTCSTA